MTAFALVSGALSRVPEVKTSKAGKPFTSATIRTMGPDNSAEFWSILAFAEAAQAELSRLGEGDKVSIQGVLKIEPYTARDGQTRINRTIFADHVLALRQPPRERKAKAENPGRTAPYTGRPVADPDDTIPF